MNRKFRTIAAVVLLLGVTCLFFGCCKEQPKVTVSSTNLTLHKGESKMVSVTFQNVTSYRFEIEDTNIAKLVTDPSSNSTLPSNGSADVTIKGCQVGNTNLLVSCTNEGIRVVVPIEVIISSSSGTNMVNTNCVQFTDKWESLDNGCKHDMQVKLLCVSDADTNRLELDGTCIKEFYGQEEAEVTKTVENGSHRILCYTIGTTDTVVNVTFEQDENGRVNNWTTHIHL